MNRDDLSIIIPSRIGSTRLKNKPLVNIKGKTLIQRVVINALEITENVTLKTIRSRRTTIPKPNPIFFPTVNLNV